MGSLSQRWPPMTLNSLINQLINQTRAELGKSLRPYDLVWPYVSTHENEAIQPSYIV